MKRVQGISGVPEYGWEEFRPKASEYCVLIPVINEGERIKKELERARKSGVPEAVDIILCDGGSTDGSMEAECLKPMGVSALLVKYGAGKQGAQLRMGIHFVVHRGYKGVVTIDGNNKDSIEDVPKFLKKLEEGYDFIQGSRFIRGGRAVNTPPTRLIALRLLHAPVISLTAGKWYTDTTNAYRGYSMKYLMDDRVQVFRDVFMTYELLAYLSVRADQLGMRTCEIPVAREYPASGKVPTKISFWKGNSELLKILFCNLFRRYNPKNCS
mgnify:FL=1